MLLLLAGATGGRAAADDTVYLASPNSPQGRLKVTGTVLDFNGKELVLQAAAGEKRYPASQVARVETESSPDELAADELLAVHDFAGAQTKYEMAMRSEKRRWVQRKIVAQLIWCLGESGQYARAGDLFLALSRDDPAGLYFACIPLRWLAASPAPDMEKKSREWLANESPAAQLMAASHLIATGERAEIVKRLQRLTTSKDPRIASLAEALIWSATFATANDREVDAWSAELEKFPEALRAGPYYVLGRALAFRHRPADAALALLRVPLLYREQRTLAATALADAGRELALAGQPDAAAGVYRELLADFPHSRAAAEAQQRLTELDAKPQPRKESD